MRFSLYLLTPITTPFQYVKVAILPLQVLDRRREVLTRKSALFFGEPLVNGLENCSKDIVR